MNLNPIGVGSGLLDFAAGTPPQWGGISPHLICKIQAWDESLMGSSSDTNNPAGAVMLNSPTVACPITDANIEFGLNWQSPFEQSGPESKAPTLMALLQSGQLGPISNAIGLALTTGDNSGISNLANTSTASADSAIASLKGRTGITKLNSRQVFSGMPPVKISMTLHFRALADPGKEVMQPYAQILKWALPQKLAKDSVIANVVSAAPSGAKAMLDKLFPSAAPQLISFVYGNCKYAPMVIEHISNPIDGHLGITGEPLYRAVQISLSTLTALDANDVATIINKGSFL